MVKKKSGQLKSLECTPSFKMLLIGIIASCFVIPVIDWGNACGVKGLALSRANAQLPKVPRKKLAVDQVSLKSGDRMFGIVTDHKEKIGTTLVVERKWFEATYPEIYAKHLKSELVSVENSAKTQLVRLKDWKEIRANEEEMVDFIDGEIARVEKLAAEENENKGENQANPANEKVLTLSQFTRIEYTPKEVKRVFRQSDEHHKVAGVAWMNQVENVTTTAFKDLERKLAELKLDVETEIVDLSAEVAASHLQSDDEWNARVCIFEYVFRKRLRYQGMGSTLIKIDPEKPADPMALMGQMMQGGMLGGLGGGGLGGGGNGLIKELLDEMNGVRPNRNTQRQPKKEEPKWWKKATDGAERDGYRAVRVTRLTQDMSNPIAKVDELFLAEISPGNWVPIFKGTASANRNEVEQGDIDFLKQDPQVEKVMGIFNALGGGNDQLLDTALRQGAATQEAMTESSNQFFDFLDRFTDNTDGPKLNMETEKKSK